MQGRWFNNVSKSALPSHLSLGCKGACRAGGSTSSKKGIVLVSIIRYELRLAQRQRLPKAARFLLALDRYLLAPLIIVPSHSQMREKAQSCCTFVTLETKKLVIEHFMRSFVILMPASLGSRVENHSQEAQARQLCSAFRHINNPPRSSHRMAQQNPTFHHLS
mmetsp:Transcript_18082/g.41840  ORF Transcript_18082/g.41840 Transcript_18082/m.41840 type:complete len:163 (-) Transcript_18082:1143-1631(-)